MWRSLLRANLAYALGSLASSAALFVLTPYFVNVLSPEEYGRWALFEIDLLVLGVVMQAGLDVGLMREYWHQPDEAERARLAGTIVVAVAFWGGALTLLGGGIALVRPIVPAVGWLLGIGWVEAVLAIYLSLFRIRERALTYVLLSVGRVALFMTGAVWLVHQGFGANGVLIGRLGAAVPALLMAAAMGRRQVRLGLRREPLRRALTYGLPLLPTNLASYVLLGSDRYFLQHFASLQTVAVYSFAYKLASTLDVAVTRPFAMDWAPRRFRLATGPDAPRRYAQVLALYSAAVVGFGLLAWAAAPAAYAVLAPAAYAPGLGVVPVLLLGYGVYGLSYPLNVGIMLKDRTYLLPFLGGAAALVCAGLNLWLIPAHGMLGAAWATVGAYLVWTGGIAVASLRVYPVPYDWRLLGRICGTGGLGALGLALLGGAPGPVARSAFEALSSSWPRVFWVGLVVLLGGASVWRGRLGPARSGPSREFNPEAANP